MPSPFVTTYNPPPSQFMAAWKPIYWYFQDTRNPNTIAGESAQIIAVQHPTVGQLGLYPTLSASDVLVIHGAMFPGTISPGQTVKLTGVSGGVYDGVHRVLEVLSNSVTKIDAPYVSDETGGVMSKHYENFRSVCVIGSTKFPLEPFVYEGDTVYILPAHLMAQRMLRGSIPDTCGFLPTLTTGALIECKAPIITAMPIAVGAKYMVPDKLGNIQLGEFLKPSHDVGLDYFAIKAVQPFVGLNSEMEAGPVTYGDNMDQFTISVTTASDFRLLTYGPIERTILPADHASVTAIAAWEGEDIRFMVKTYDSTGTLIATTTTGAGGFDVGTALYFPCGPQNLPLAITNSVSYYDVGIQVPSVGSGFLNNKVVRFHVDRNCQVSSLRLHWRNKAGGEDSHTFTGGYQMGSGAERLTLSRDYIDPEFSSGDDLESWWSERVWRVNPERKFRLESGPVSMETAHWLGTDLFESADVYAYVAGFDAPIPVILTQKSVDDVASSTGKRRSVSIEFRLGADNLSQGI